MREELEEPRRRALAHRSSERENAGSKDLALSSAALPS